MPGQGRSDKWWKVFHGLKADGKTDEQAAKIASSIAKHGDEHDEKSHGNWSRKKKGTGLITKPKKRTGHSAAVLPQDSERVASRNRELESGMTRFRSKKPRPIAPVDQMDVLSQAVSRRKGQALQSEFSQREQLLASNEIETFMDIFGPDWVGALTAHRQGDLSEFVTKAHNRLLVDDAWSERIDIYSEFLTKRGKTRFEGLLERAGGVGEIREREVADIFKTAFDSGGRTASVVTDHIIDFDPNHPRVVAWIEDNATDLIKDLDTETRDVVKVLLREAVNDGTSEEILKGRIANWVGLDERRARAVARFQAQQVINGVPPGRVDRLSKAYARRLREQRAESIVRTEIQKAVEAGKLEFWKQAADSGLITRGESWREWVVHKDERLCPWCRPVGGKRARLGGQFFTPLGKVDGPPLHVNCRCFTELEAPLHLQTPIIKHPHHSSSQSEHGNWARGGAKRTTGAPDYVPLEDAGKTRRQKVDDALADRKRKRKVPKGRLKRGSRAAQKRLGTRLLAGARGRWDRFTNRQGKGIGLRTESAFKNAPNTTLREILDGEMRSQIATMDKYKLGGATTADKAKFRSDIARVMDGRKDPGPRSNRFDSPGERKRLNTKSEVGRHLDIKAKRDREVRIAERFKRNREERIARAKKRAEDDK